MEHRTCWLMLIAPAKQISLVPDADKESARWRRIKGFRIGVDEVAPSISKRSMKLGEGGGPG